ERRQLYQYLGRLGIQQVEALEVPQEIGEQENYGGQQQATRTPWQCCQLRQAAALPQKQEHHQRCCGKAHPCQGQHVDVVQQHHEHHGQHAPHERSEQRKEEALPVA